MAANVEIRRVADRRGFQMEPFEAYERAIRRRVDLGKLPGYCSAVLYQGELLHSDAYGFADPERGLKYGPDVLMRMYCMSKPFVAVSILLLQDRGRLSVNDPVSKYLPNLRRLSVASRANSVRKSVPLKPKAMTILHCLTHTAGFVYGRDFNQEPDSAETKSCHELVRRVEHGEVKSLEQFVDELADVPLRSHPGTQYAYSYATDVLGRLVEVVSGMPLSKFFEKEIFGPLGMRDTAFFFPRSKAHRWAALYASRDSAIMMGAAKSSLPARSEALCRIDGMVPEDSRWSEGRRCRVESGGGIMGANSGGLVSTLSDCMRFFGMLACDGKLGTSRRILKPASIKRYCLLDLLPEVITSGKRQRANRAPFGWSTVGEVGVPRSARDAAPKSNDNFELGEVGGGGAACTYWSINPTRRLATLWFTQSMDNDPYVKDNENIYLAARAAVPVVPVEPFVPKPLRAKGILRKGCSSVSLQQTGSGSLRAAKLTPVGRKVRQRTRQQHARHRRSGPTGF